MEEKNLSSGTAIGIDLGTTNSVMGLYTGEVKIIQCREGDNTMPSVVMWDEKNNEYLIGRPALNKAGQDYSQAVFSVKRLMGNPLTDENVQMMIKEKRFAYKIGRHSKGTAETVGITLGKDEFLPEEISAKILCKIKDDAEYRLGKPVTHAVITVPAYFSEAQRTATYNAGVAAGFRVMNIIEEPTSAAIAFGMENLKPDEVKNLLVYDLGGGTFDISILMAAAGSFSVCKIGGDKWLAGDNFDEKIMEWLKSRMKADYGIDIDDERYPEKQRNRNRYDLRIKSREAKEQLSSLSAADILLTWRTLDNDIIDASFRLTREDFENMIRPMIERTVELALERVSATGLKPEEIDKVLMVGGSTRIPLVQKRMEEVFGREKIVRDIDPMLCVAMGAAIIAGRINKIICPKCKAENDPMSEKCANCAFEFAIKVPEEKNVNRVSPFNYGVQSMHDKFHVYVNEGEPYPHQGDPLPPADCRKYRFQTIVEDQRMIRIPVFAGKNLERASCNQKEGEAFSFLPAGLPKGTPFQIRLWMDPDGKFLLDAHLIHGTEFLPLQILILRKEDLLFAQNIDDLADAESLWAKIKSEPTKDFEKKKEIMSLREDIYEDYAGKKEGRQEEQGGMSKKVQEYRKKLEEYEAQGKEPTGFEQEEWALYYAQTILGRYHFMLSPDTSLKLGELAEKLRSAITKKDRKTAQAIKEELNDLFNTDNAVSWAIVFINVSLRLQSSLTLLRGNFPEQYQKVLGLKDEFAKAEEMLKNNNYNGAINAVTSIDAELTVIEKEIADIPQKPGEEIVCMSEECKKEGGTKNPKYITKCRKCGCNLTFISHETSLNSPS